MNRFNTNTGILLMALSCVAPSHLSAQPSPTSPSIVSIDFEKIRQEAERMATLVPELTEQSQAIVDQFMQLEDLNWQEMDMESSFSAQKEKVIEKVYSVNSKHRLSIDNRYGKIAVHNWDRNQVKVTIKIRTDENSERRAQEALDRVRVDESASGRDISLKTSISSSDSNWWSTLTSDGGDRSLRVDYEIYMPVQNELTLANRYGPIELGDRSGKVTLSVSYGSLSAGRLTASGNSLSVSYSNADVNYLQDAAVSVRYGRLSLGESERLELSLSYSGGDIGKVNEEAAVSVRYGGTFNLGLGSSIKKADISASYSNINIEPAANAAFGFNVSVDYGSFDYDRNRANFNSKSEKATSKQYTGYWNKSVTNSVNISARYGNINLK